MVRIFYFTRVGKNILLCTGWQGSSTLHGVAGIFYFTRGGRELLLYTGWQGSPTLHGMVRIFYFTRGGKNIPLYTGWQEYSTLHGVVRIFYFARGGRDHVFLVSPLSYIACHHSSTILFGTLLHFQCSSTMLVNTTNCQHSSIYSSTLSALP